MIPDPPDPLTMKLGEYLQARREYDMLFRQISPPDIEPPRKKYWVVVFPNALAFKGTDLYVCSTHMLTSDIREAKFCDDEAQAEKIRCKVSAPDINYGIHHSHLPAKVMEITITLGGS